MVTLNKSPKAGVTKMAKPLTNTEVKQAKPKDKYYILLNGEGLAFKNKKEL